MIIPIYTNAIATAKLIAVINAIIPEDICLLFVWLTDFIVLIIFSEPIFATTLSTSNGDIKSIDASLILVVCFKSVLVSIIIKYIFYLK